MHVSKSETPLAIQKDFHTIVVGSLAGSRPILQIALEYTKLSLLIASAIFFARSVF